MTSDKELERQRYDNRAQELINKDVGPDSSSGSLSLPPSIRSPYLCYERKLQENITSTKLQVLEIGAGTGAFTKILLKTGASIHATDISESSLEFLKKKFAQFGNLETRVADMESLPFEDNSFDIVASAGSLSYGDNKIVLGELHRVLKDGGKFVCVDSLNHNIIYRLNRWIHYLRGNRTMSTLKRMPTLSLIEQYRNLFGSCEVYYFGSLSWAAPLLKPVLNEEKTAQFFDWFDNTVTVKKSAFKFVLIVTKN